MSVKESPFGIDLGTALRRMEKVRSDGRNITSFVMGMVQKVKAKMGADDGNIACCDISAVVNKRQE